MSSLPMPSAPPVVQRARESFSDFVSAYRDRLTHLFGTRHDVDATGTERGVPPFVIQRFRDVDPLSVFVPQEYGGRGGPIGHGWRC